MLLSGSERTNASWQYPKAQESRGHLSAQSFGPREQLRPGSENISFGSEQYCKYPTSLSDHDPSNNSAQNSCTESLHHWEQQTICPNDQTSSLIPSPLSIDRFSWTQGDSAPTYSRSTQPDTPSVTPSTNRRARRRLHISGTRQNR